VLLCLMGRKEGHGRKEEGEEEVCLNLPEGKEEEEGEEEGGEEEAGSLYSRQEAYMSIEEKL